MGIDGFEEILRGRLQLGKLRGSVCGFGSGCGKRIRYADSVGGFGVRKADSVCGFGKRIWKADSVCGRRIR